MFFISNTLSILCIMLMLVGLFTHIKENKLTKPDDGSLPPVSKKVKRIFTVSIVVGIIASIAAFL